MIRWPYLKTFPCQHNVIVVTLCSARYAYSLAVTSVCEQ